jgi:hypothetical protein
LEKEVIFADDVEKILGPKVKPAEEETPVQENKPEDQNLESPKSEDPQKEESVN